MKKTLVVLLTFCMFMAPVNVVAVSKQITEAIECPICMDQCFNPNYAQVKSSVITHMPGTDEQDLHILCRTCFARLMETRDHRCPVCREEIDRVFTNSASQQVGIFNQRRELKQKEDKKGDQRQNQAELERKRQQELEQQRQREREQELQRRRDRDQAQARQAEQDRQQQQARARQAEQERQRQIEREYQRHQEQRQQYERQAREQAHQQQREQERRAQERQRQQEQARAQQQQSNKNDNGNPPNGPRPPSNPTWNIGLLICALPFVLKWYVNKLNLVFA